MHDDRKKTGKHAAYRPYDGREARRIVEPIPAGTRVLPTVPRLRPDAAAVGKSRPELLIEYLFAFAAFLGDFTLTAALYVLRVYGVRLARFGELLLLRVRRAFASLGAALSHTRRAAAADVRDLQSKLGEIHAQAKRAKKYSRKTSMYFRFFALRLVQRRGFWLRVRNVGLPLLALAMLAVVCVGLHHSTFALEVEWNGASLGYVESEQTFDDAKARALSLLSADETEQDAAWNAAPRFRLCRVGLDELSNGAQLCEQLMYAGDRSLTQACGIYINGEFLCAVRNEADAASVFQRLLQAQETRAPDASMVTFAEEITYVQGMYPDNESTLWDSLTLSRTLLSPKSEAQYHSVKAGDTVYSIAKQNGVSVSQLRALNPTVDFSRLLVTQKILVAQQTDYVHIKVMKPRTRTVPQPYETEKRESGSLPQGAVQVLQEGKDGKQRVTELVTYIDGKETVYTVVSAKTLVKPVNEVLLVGTQNGVYAGGTSAAGFVWPAIGAYSLSSGFGYRSARISGWSFHGGVDIVKPGGGSTGLPVIAAAAGTVVVAQNGYRGYGHTVVIDHGGGLQTRYAHMQPGSITVRVGQTVSQGQQIGRIGSTGNVTGPHLHFEVMRGGAKVDPLNYLR